MEQHFRYASRFEQLCFWNDPSSKNSLFRCTRTSDTPRNANSPQCELTTRLTTYASTTIFWSAHPLVCEPKYVARIGRECVWKRNQTTLGLLRSKWDGKSNRKAKRLIVSIWWKVKGCRYEYVRLMNDNLFRCQNNQAHIHPYAQFILA